MTDRIRYTYELRVGVPKSTPTWWIEPAMFAVAGHCPEPNTIVQATSHADAPAVRGEPVCLNKLERGPAQLCFKIYLTGSTPQWL